MAGSQGSVIWFEIWVFDIEQSKAFYNGLFGWTFEPLADYDAEKYWQIVVPDSAAVNGALVHDPERDKPTGRTSVLYIHVPDLEQATQQALSLGGTLVQGRTKITESAGSFGIIADPEGNELGLWVP